jgi:hypothetical protein
MRPARRRTRLIFYGDVRHHRGLTTLSSNSRQGPPCPTCGNTNTKRLTFPSALHEVDTFLCLACDAVWSTPANPPPAAKVHG